MFERKFSGRKKGSNEALNTSDKKKRNTTMMPLSKELTLMPLKLRRGTVVDKEETTTKSPRTGRRKLYFAKKKKKSSSTFRNNSAKKSERNSESADFLKDGDQELLEVQRQSFFMLKNDVDKNFKSFSLTKSQKEKVKIMEEELDDKRVSKILNYEVDVRDNFKALSDILYEHDEEVIEVVPVKHRLQSSKKSYYRTAYSYGDMYSITDADPISTSSTASEDYDQLYDFEENVIEEIVQASLKKFGYRKFLNSIKSRNFIDMDLKIIEKCIQQQINRIKNEEKFLERSLSSFFPEVTTTFLSYHWSDRFSKLRSENDREKIVSLENDFNSTVETISKIIILEKSRPNYLKSIKVANIGGRAGGEKYITHGILFKFASDVYLGGHWLYGGPERNDFLASKAMNNDIKALRALFPITTTSCIKLPLMSTYSYLGTVICAVSLLPVNETTLVYGSSNGGYDLYDGLEEPELLTEIEKIRNLFNFSEHLVEDSKKVVKSLSLAADVEIHKVKDVFYILDLGRFFPSNNPLQPFVHLIRHEALIEHKDLAPEGLSCDAFSGFGRLDKERHNQNVKEFIQKYTSIALKKLISDTREGVLKSEENISITLHSYGFNLRYMGYIRKQLMKYPEPVFVDLQKGILREMIMRSLKSLFSFSLNNMMENQIIPIENEYKEKIIEMYEDFRIDSPSWQSEKLKLVMTIKFSSMALSLEETESTYNLLHDFSNDERISMYDEIPKYCRFVGGTLNFTTVILGKIKSCIPKDNTENEVRQVVDKQNVSQKDLFQIKKYIFSSDIPEDLLFDYLLTFYENVTEKNYLENMTSTLLKKFSYFVGKFKEARMADLCEAIWEMKTNILFLKATLVVTIQKHPAIKKLLEGRFIDKKVKKLISDVFEKGKLNLYKDYPQLINDVVNFVDFFSNYLSNIEIECSSVQILSIETISSCISNVILIDELQGALISSSLHYLTNLEIYEHTFSPKIFQFQLLQSLKIISGHGHDFYLTTRDLSEIFDFEHLESLALVGLTQIDDKIFEIISQLSLTNLDLSGCPQIGILDDKVQRNACFPLVFYEIGLTLYRLNISKTAFNDTSIEWISNLFKLNSLIASELEISDIGVRYFARITNLEYLDISSCNPKKITSMSIYYISLLPKLYHLNVRGIAISEFILEKIENMHSEKGVNVTVGDKSLMKKKKKLKNRDRETQSLMKFHKILLHTVVEVGVPIFNQDQSHQVSNFLQNFTNNLKVL